MKRNRITPPSSLHGYNFGQLIGIGSFGSVFEAQKIVNGCDFAIKVIPKSIIKNDIDLVRFQAEIDAQAFLKSEFVVSLHDFFSDLNNYYLVLDLCKGGELNDYILEHDKLSEPVAALIFQQIVSAVSYCHSNGVIHRDLKPHNILISEFPRIKVSDFGLCSVISENFLLNTFCGSPSYCSPECLCRQQFDARLSDIWSMGVVLYTMVVGKTPWNSDHNQTVYQQIMKGDITFPNHVSHQCRDLVTLMLKVNPNERATMKEIIAHSWMKTSEWSNIAEANQIMIKYYEKEENCGYLRSRSKGKVLYQKTIMSPFEPIDLEEKRKDKNENHPTLSLNEKKDHLSLSYQVFSLDSYFSKKKKVLYSCSSKEYIPIIRPHLPIHF